VRILVARRDSFGDVLCTTPILRRLRRENPDATINVHTWYPYVFVGNDDVDLASNGNDLHARKGHANLFTGQAPEGNECNLSGNYDRVIDLNLAFEKRFRKMRAVDAYMEEAFGDTGDDAEKGVVLADVPCPEITGLDVRDAVVMHPARSERCRTLPHGFWQELVRVLKARGRRIVTVGTSQDYDLDGVADTKNKLTPQMQAALIRRSSALVASESGILGGVLPATSTPAVGLMTISLPEVGGPYRMGGYNRRFWPIMAKVDCVGCAARYTTVITAHGCLEDRDYECVRTFDPIEVADTVEEAAATDRSADE
jgi:ADP-heptose:LPS heptosyltransferase